MQLKICTWIFPSIFKRWKIPWFIFFTFFLINFATLITSVGSGSELKIIFTHKNHVENKWFSIKLNQMKIEKIEMKNTFFFFLNLKIKLNEKLWKLLRATKIYYVLHQTFNTEWRIIIFYIFLSRQKILMNMKWKPIQLQKPVRDEPTTFSLTDVFSFSILTLIFWRKKIDKNNAKSANLPQERESAQRKKRVHHHLIISTHRQRTCWGFMI